MIFNLRNNNSFYFFLLLYLLHYLCKQWATPFYTGWFRNYLGDFLCLPLVLSVSLMAMQNLTLNKIYRLSFSQVALTFVLFSFYFEWFFPQFLNLGVPDWLDVFYYALGGLLFLLLFNPVKQSGTVLENHHFGKN